MKKGSRLLLAFSLVLILVGGAIYFYEQNPQVYNTAVQAGVDMDMLDSLGKWEGELSGGKYYVFVNQSGKELDQTSHEVFVGDEVILENNERYRVTSVDMEKGQAVCELVGHEDIAWREEWDQIPVLDVAENQNGKIGIYMTHTDESYVPTDGTESKPGAGGIQQVGNAYAERLKGKGVNTEISFDKFDPHDANAYNRSRRTAAKLLKSNPVAIFDVHRDGVPDPSYYKTTLNGEPSTKVRLVVGRQNPHMSANLEFAKQIKAYFDKTTPGLIKGIFMAKGNYNQDLSPHAMLIEVGTHTNSKQDAQNGATLFGDGIPQLLSLTANTGTSPGPGPSTSASRSGAYRSIIWILALVIIGGGAFLLVSTGSFKGSWEKISGLGKEFSGYMGPLESDRKKVETVTQTESEQGGPENMEQENKEQSPENQG